jgi:hypothetical protein
MSGHGHETSPDFRRTEIIGGHPKTVKDFAGLERIGFSK